MMKDENEYVLPVAEQTFFGKKGNIIAVSLIGFSMLGFSAPVSADNDTVKSASRYDQLSEEESITEFIDTFVDPQAQRAGDDCCNTYSSCCNEYTKGFPNQGVPGCCNTFSECYQKPPVT